VLLQAAMMVEPLGYWCGLRWHMGCTLWASPADLSGQTARSDSRTTPRLGAHKWPSLKVRGIVLSDGPLDGPTGTFYQRRQNFCVGSPDRPSVHWTGLSEVEQCRTRPLEELSR
jgi:hypothetical protein